MTERPGGAPFIDGLPASVIDRFERSQAKTASAGPIEVTHLYCPQNELGGAPGQDSTTHHLVPKGPAGGRSQTCRYCGKTEKVLREAEEQRRREQG